jgi:predicted RNase H-like nuclease (RuvC/YqgF family)
MKKLLSPKQAKPEHVSRAEFYAEMMATRERINATHLAILEKLDANHRELLAALERLATRINTLEASLARVDERTRKSSANCANSRE